MTTKKLLILLMIGSLNLTFSACAPSLSADQAPSKSFGPNSESAAPSISTRLDDGAADSATLAVNADTAPQRNNDPRCQVTGCSGEVCQTPQPAEDDGLNYQCEWQEYYDCFKISSCQMKEDSCGWEVSPAFVQCLKDKQAPPNVLKKYTGQQVVDLIERANDQLSAMNSR